MEKIVSNKRIAMKTYIENDDFLPVHKMDVSDDKSGFLLQNALIEGTFDYGIKSFTTPEEAENSGIPGVSLIMQQFPPTSSLSPSFNIYKKKEPPTENTAGIYLNFLAWPINFLGNGDRKQDLRPIPCDLPRRCSLLANANFPGIDPFCIFRSRILNSLAII